MTRSAESWDHTESTHGTGKHEYIAKKYEDNET